MESNEIFLYDINNNFNFETDFVTPFFYSNCMENEYVENSVIYDVNNEDILRTRDKTDQLTLPDKTQKEQYQETKDLTVNPKGRRKQKDGFCETTINDDVKNKSAFHSKMDSDNIKRKLKVHFMHYLIEFLNERIKTEWNGFQIKKFRRIAHQYTKNITINYNRNILKGTVRDLLSNEVSIKFNCKSNINATTCDFLLKQKPLAFSFILDMTVAQFYQQYFCGDSKALRKQYGLGEKNLIAKRKKTLLFFEDYIFNKTNQHDYYYSRESQEDRKYLEKYEQEGRAFVSYFFETPPRKRKK